MTDFVNDYFAANPGTHRKCMVTKDGQLFSVQASSGHYCSPKDDVGPYNAVEVLVENSRLKFPDWPEPSEKFDNGDRLWGWLRVSHVNDEIRRRGGLAS